METRPPWVAQGQNEELLPSQALLDAGGESGEVLLAALEACMEALGPGQVLEVISQHPDAVTDVPLWCGRAGHEVVATAHREQLTIWIRKRL